MNIIETLARAGLVIENMIVREYDNVDSLPKEYNYDAARGDCVDSYKHSVGTREHFGDFIVVREKKHWCQGSTEHTFHVAKAAWHRPSGGEIPISLCKIFRTAFRSHTPEEVWTMTPEQGRSAVCISWSTANMVARAIMNGEITEEWLPEGSTGGAGEMWLNDAIRVAYSRNTNPLPLLRRMFPKCSWEFSREKVVLAEKRGMCPIYETGDVVFVCEVKGGFVKATFTGESDNSPL